jgi:hypothetical protein
MHRRALPVGGGSQHSSLLYRHSLTFFVRALLRDAVMRLSAASGAFFDEYHGSTVRWCETRLDGGLASLESMLLALCTVLVSIATSCAGKLQCYHHFISSGQHP